MEKKDIETRVSLIEAQCHQCPDIFNKINYKLDEINKNILEIKLEQAENRGRAKSWKTLISGAGGGGFIVGIIKLIDWIK